MIYQPNNSISIGGNAIGNNISAGGNIQGSPKSVVGGGSSEFNERQQLKSDLQEVQNILFTLRTEKPDISQSQEVAKLTRETSKPLQERLINAFVAGGKTAIEEFLDIPYVNVVVAAIEGWNS
ncbi:hypothetical protein [Leptolyngbya iicbica]|uniref:Pentapeptide repeat-containing protein n=2 Tax=Cyanophyceae TaxID=3028117 RepID=A0A4Q7EB27_9CYAN|nr:hypothetical protein [Leptolyngbya sp. LK]RZM79739.1 hypothetical protein DYY88_13695 [Leptolyngbya sp. LK]